MDGRSVVGGQMSEERDVPDRVLVRDLVAHGVSIPSVATSGCLKGIIVRF
jgi:hypothetical protein